MGDQLPALQVVVPLIVAPLVLLFNNGRAAWSLATGASWFVLFAAWLLLLQARGGSPVIYSLGGWLAPWGIEYRIDALNGFVLVIVAFASAVIMPYAGTSVAREIPADRLPAFYTLFLLCLVGLLGITITGDVFNLFVFLEISSLSSYVLIAMGSDRRALTAALRYLIMGTIGATFILTGVGLLYMMTGTLNMDDLAARLPAVWDTRTVRAAFAFLTVGISLKLALFPLHLWMPNAYAFAPSVVSAFLAATATKVAAYVLIRFAYGIFGTSFAFGVMPLGEILTVAATLAILSGSAVAIAQDNVKRLLAYSSVAQIGYTVLGVGLASAAGLTAGILHLFNHALMKGALFLALGCVIYRIGGATLAHISGLGRRMPWTAAALLLGGMSLVGIPGTAGFVSKWYLFTALLQGGHWALAVAVAVGSLLAALYVWRVVEAAYLRSPPDDWSGAREEAPLSLLIPTWVLVLANLYFGLDTDFTVGAASQAARLFPGVS